MTGNSLALRIAYCYLRAPKSHSAVSAISKIAVAGVAVATAAIICVLSVFNGFRDVLSTRLDTLVTDVSVSPALGKAFENGDSLAMEIAKIDGVEFAMPAITENALIIADSREMPITLKGVNPAQYARMTAVDSLIFEGNPVSRFSVGDAAVAIGVARRMNLYDTDVPLFVFVPKREGRVNMANPMASFMTDSLNVSGYFQSLQNDYDDATVITDIETVRELLQYDSHATSIEIKSEPGTDDSVLAQRISNVLGDGYVIRDRLQQQQTNYRMVSIEKWITFLLLSFILLIAGFNIIGTMCMVILEKQSSMGILGALGMKRGRIGGIFSRQSIMVTFAGGLIGVALGVALTLLQQHFGFIKLNGDPQTLTMLAYPVKLQWLDILIALAPIAVLSLISAIVSASFSKKRLPL